MHCQIGEQCNTGLGGRGGVLGGAYKLVSIHCFIPQLNYILHHGYVIYLCIISIGYHGNGIYIYIYIYICEDARC